MEYHWNFIVEKEIQNINRLTRSQLLEYAHLQTITTNSTWIFSNLASQYLRLHRFYQFETREFNFLVGLKSVFVALHSRLKGKCCYCHMILLI